MNQNRRTLLFGVVVIVSVVLMTSHCWVEVRGDIVVEEPGAGGTLTSDEAKELLAKTPPRHKEEEERMKKEIAPAAKKKMWRPQFTSKGLTHNKVLSDNKKANNYNSKKNFPNEALGYITPWNADGFDIALRFQSKFTFLSPVWFQIKRHASSTQFRIEGKEGIDRDWIAKMRGDMKSNSKEKRAKIVPRFLMESWSREDYLSFFSSSSSSSQLSSSLSRFVSENDFDGLVFDMGYTGFRDPRNGNNVNSKNEGLMNFFRNLGTQLHSSGKTLIVVVPPGAGFVSNDLVSLSEYVDRFSLMAYDYSTHQPGPNAPFPWFHSLLSSLLGEHGQPVDEEVEEEEEAVEEDLRSVVNHPLAHKILIGMNFYGYDFSSSGYNRPPSATPLLGRDYIRLLERHKPKEIRWDDDSKEHSFIYFEDEQTGLDPQGNPLTTRIKHIVFYPSIRSIQVRLLDSFLFGAGISIWEIGQGLEFFYSLL
eukprot:TRINITY_DN7334_c0_g1_i2.p1 TRINITY_DN7334_c0_g1~~TRINITY_DN7334_c0_g1_i2.p1  ORF type:complete len:477 (+),score=118.08 TRINITY_DN7334_c0_g1_i2:28-1458(+)